MDVPLHVLVLMAGLVSAGCLGPVDAGPEATGQPSEDCSFSPIGFAGSGVRVLTAEAGAGAVELELQARSQDLELNAITVGNASTGLDGQELGAGATRSVTVPQTECRRHQVTINYSVDGLSVQATGSLRPVR